MLFTPENKKMENTTADNLVSFYDLSSVIHFREYTYTKGGLLTAGSGLLGRL